MTDLLPQRFSRVAFAALLLLGVFALPAAAAPELLVAPRATWKYLDNGSDQGTAWRERTFDDAAWASGAAELGYGEADEATVVGYGADVNNRHVTTYFRHSFQVTDPSRLTSMVMRLIRDDGAVVYVNGVEVWRSNMPSGAVASTTLAYMPLSGADETTWQQKNLAASFLVEGTNVIAVEMHQSTANSSDLSFAFELVNDSNSLVPTVARGPYLQSGTPNSVVVRWRTDIAADGRVRYGTSLDDLSAHVDDDNHSIEHSVTLTGLSPHTRYYYTVGTKTTPIAGDSTYSFRTSPEAGTSVPTRVWVLGDSGTGGAGAAAVRNAYYGVATPAMTNLWLMLGDNAYDNGTDEDYQKAVFNMYPEMLRASVLWPAIGNHDTAEKPFAPPDLPYFNMFTLPTRGEAGGVASGSESYYSFDYGDIHFICLDSMTSDRSVNGPMLTWLRDDLASTNQRWIIAFFHHPPYSKGSHNSDTSIPLIEMRQNAVPILEDAGVDLILAGHSHSYERSFLIDGHYGHSSSFVSSMKRNGGSGRPTETGAYRKPGTSTHEGAVYVVAGSSAKATGGTLDHPAMFISLNKLGSMVLEIRGNEMEVKFLRETGAVDDSFTIVKGPAAPAAATSAAANATSTSSIDLTWSDNSSDEDGFRVERCSGASCTNFAAVTQTTAGVSSFSDTGLSATTLYRYRVIAFNATGDAPASDVAEATTLTPCTAAAITQGPAATTIFVGQSARLSASATGTAPLAFQWYRGESGTTTTPIAGATTSSMNVAPTTTSSYWVRVTNGCSSVDSATAIVTVKPIPPLPPGTQNAEDFNGDGRADVLWRNYVSGRNILWLMDGGTRTNADVPPLADLNWEAAAIGDFDGNGSPDIFWRDDSTGANTIWLMAGTKALSANPQQAVSRAEMLAGTGDFNGDGREDLFWRNTSTGANTIWLMNGAIANVVATTSVTDQRWIASAFGDFDGDGRDDVFWRNRATGATNLWLMNAAKATSSKVRSVTDLDWAPRAAADFNADGRADVMWRNEATGANAIWFMNGATVTSTAALPSLGAGWRPVAFGDFDGTRTGDIFWRNMNDGSIRTWLMNGGKIVASPSHTSVKDPAWRVERAQ